MSQFTFANKTVLITGASSGIGAGAAIAFAKLGANLVLGGRNEENLKATRDACIKEGLKSNQIALVPGDVTHENVKENFVVTSLKSFGQIDVLINNAGISASLPIADLNMEGYDKIVNVNLRAVVDLTLKCVPHLIKTKGAVVNISSVASWRPIQIALPYCVAKAGLDMFTKCLAFELAPQGVRVNSVNPGGVVTNIGRDHQLSPEEQEQRYKMVTNFHPIGRFGEVKEIADSIVFLASSSASFTTGQCLGVCGGASLGGVRF